MSWELSPSLARAREEANRIAPHRSKRSDGTIGDPAHAARASDHNPGARNRVHALDLTHDPANGWDVGERFEQLRRNQDRRVKYLIFDRRIASAERGWGWRPYTGSNPHTTHGHISIWSTVAAETDTRPWWRTTEPPPKPVVYLFRNTLNGVPVRCFNVRIPTDGNGDGSYPAVCPVEKFIAATGAGVHDKYDDTGDTTSLVAPVGWRNDGGHIRLTVAGGPKSAEVHAWVTVAD